MSDPAVTVSPLAAARRQWPVLAVAAASILLARWVVLFLSASLRPSLGETAVVALSIGFLALLESLVLIGAVFLLELLPSRLASLVDWGKGLSLAALVVLALASLGKLHLTGSPLGETDIWFLRTNTLQLAAESSGLERSVAAALLLLFVLLTVAGRRGFAQARRSGTAVPGRPLALLLVLSLVGSALLLARYPTVRTASVALAPEIGWLAGRGADGSGPPPAAVPALPPTGAPIEPYTPEPRPEAPNVLLVMLESIPGQLFFEPEVAAAMPNVVRLASESIHFTRPYAPSVHSDYAQMAILSSLHPRKYPRHDFYRALPYPRTLVWDALAPAGWRTAMFSCQNEAWGNMLSYLATPGIELIRHSPDWPLAPHKGRGTESKVFEETVVRAWREWLDELDDGSPWFAYLNFQAPHFPYEIPPAAERPFRPDEIDFPASYLHYPRDEIPVIRNRFLNAVHYSDRWLGEVVAELERRGELDETWLVVVSDHGEAFYEHGQPTHGTTLHEEQVRSLLLARIPGAEPRSVEAPVGLLDLLPSLTRELGLPVHGNFQGASDIFVPDYSADGRPFYFTIQGMTAEDGILLDDWKYTINWQTGREQLFDLATDPAESRNLIGDEPERALALATALERFLNRQLTYYDRALWRTGFYPAPVRGGHRAGGTLPAAGPNRRAARSDFAAPAGLTAVAGSSTAATKPRPSCRLPPGTH